MKISIYIRGSGLEAIAKGKDPYSWDFLVTHKGGCRDPEPSAIRVVEDLEVALPDREICVRGALAKLEDRKKEIQSEAYKELLEVENRIKYLLALEGPAS